MPTVIDTSLSTAPLPAVIDHIVSTHHDYLKRELPALQDRIDRIAHNPALSHTFARLRAELEAHLMKEENILFPVIRAYVDARNHARPLPRVPFGSVANPIRMMEHEHENATEALAILSEEIPALTSPAQLALRDDLLAFLADMRQHIHLEDDILFPRAIRLEAGE
jgi:regulator of cell morphogenesis and NO signaling